MALLKELETNYGVNAAYWKITEVQINWTTPSVMIKVSGYASEEAGRGDSLPLVDRPIYIDLSQGEVREGGQFAYVAKILNEALYGAIKAQELDFADAKDVQ